MRLWLDLACSTGREGEECSGIYPLFIIVRIIKLGSWKWVGYVLHIWK
jgi:hypothetical protein